MKKFYVLVLSVISLVMASSAYASAWLDDGWKQVEQHHVQKALGIWQYGVDQLPDRQLLIVLALHHDLNYALELAQKAPRSEAVFVLSTSRKGKTRYYVLSSREASLERNKRYEELTPLRQALGVKRKLLGNFAKKFKTNQNFLHNAPVAKQKAKQVKPVDQHKLAKPKQPAALDLNLSVDELIAHGYAQYQQGNYEESAMFLNKAGLIEPKNGQVPYYLGLTYQGMTHLDEAELQFAKAVALDTTIGDAWSHLGEMLYRKGKYEDAKQALINAEKYGARPAYTSYMKGLAQQQLLEFDDAIVSFERAKELAPGFAQKSYYALGMVYNSQKKISMAKKYFKQTIAIDADSIVGVYADFELKRLNKPAKRLWHVNLAYDFQYDDNVVLIPDGASPSLLTSGQSDFGHVVSFNLNYQPELSGRLGMRMDAVYYRNTHQKLTYMDIDVAGLTLSPSYKTDMGVLSFATSGNYILVGGNNYMYTLAVKPSLGFEIGKKQFGSLMMGVQQSKYWNQVLSVAAENRDSLKYSAGYTHFIYTHQKKGYVKLAYRYDSENTKGNNWDAVTQNFSAAIAYPFLTNMKFQLGGNYVLQDFQHVSTFFSRVRKDKVLNVSANVTKKFKWASVHLDYTHSRGKSNVAAYTYTRNVMGLGLNVAY